MSGAKSFVDKFEENTIGILLGLMTLITFANVIARYVFNSNILWALELTVFMFAWLVLLGASYAVKISAHLGVDAILNLVSPKAQKVMGMLSACVCIAFSLLLLKGSWDYWAPFANLPPTQGHWFPTGFVENSRGQGWWETKDIPIPGVLRFVEDIFNEGEAYEKLPKVIPYFVMPLSMTLLLFRFSQAAVRLWKGEINNMIASHEAEEAVEEAAKELRD